MFFKRKGKYGDYSTEHSSLRKGLSVTGDIDSPEDMLIDCRINGNIVCGGRIVVGKGGDIQGNIRTVAADIQGKVRGNIGTAGVLILHATANVEGSITAVNLEIHPGAQFAGNCIVMKEEDEQSGSEIICQRAN